MGNRVRRDGDDVGVDVGTNVDGDDVDLIVIGDTDDVGSAVDGNVGDAIDGHNVGHACKCVGDGDGCLYTGYGSHGSHDSGIISDVCCDDNSVLCVGIFMASSRHSASMNISS